MKYGHTRTIDYTVRAECERAGVAPRALIQVLDHLPAETLEASLGFLPADFDLEAEKTEAYDNGFTHGEMQIEKSVERARELLSGLGRARDHRALISRALHALTSDADAQAAENVVESFLEAIDELVEDTASKAARKAARKARAKALARFKVRNARVAA